MKRRVLALLLALMMLLAMTSVSVLANTTIPTITLESIKAENGQDVAIKVSIENNPGIWGMDLKISYDKTALTLTSVDNGDFYQASEWTKSNLSADVYILSYEASGFDNITTQSGTLATLNFKVSDTASAGDYAVTATYNAGDIINVDFDDINFDIVNGKISIQAKPVSVMGVTIDENLSLKTGETKMPAFAVSPAEATNKTVSFKSSDTSVATVNETTGAVTGVKKGTATITITTADGNYTDTCTVTVSCSHANKTNVGEKVSDCKSKGWDAYVKCNDCGQLFAADEATEIEEIPFRQLSDQHTGGEATCTAQAVCTVCNLPYGALAAHSYTADTKKAETLKTAGNCRDDAVYYYSCSVCGNVEGNNSHTFNGGKVPSTHVGGSHIEGASEPDHKTQTAGSTGAEICDGCGATLTSAQPIQPGEHTPANVWSNNETYHWKECTVVGCGVVINGSKAEHTSTNSNVATCQKAAVCDVCSVSYGTVAAHDWAITWSKDASGHWYACQTSGCTEKNGFATHTPDHQGGATEEYAIKCSICGYEIEAQLAHAHVFDQEKATDAYKASDATCTIPATYYKSCKCGEKGTAIFSYGTALGHTEGTEWKSDADNHWHICSVAGCGVLIDTSKAAHTPDRSESTETDPVKCSICGYEIAPALGHTHAYDTEWKSDKDNHWNECACGDKANAVAHKDENNDGKCDVCAYNVGIPTEPSNPDSPQTGDNSMMWLWVTLLFVSGFGVVATIVIGKKRSVR